MKPDTLAHPPAIKTADSVLSLSGDIVIASVPDIEKQLLNSLNNITSIDLSGTARIDSAGLALFINIFESARQKGQEITLANVPESLVKLSKLSSAESLLGLE